MADRLTIFYPQRRNPDGCFESICLTCFAKIATAKTEQELFSDKEKHICESSTLVQRSLILREMNKTRSDF
jgi:hypothetical protein